MEIKRKKRKINFLFLLKNLIYYLLLVFIFFAYFIKSKFNNVSFEQLLFTLTNPDGGNFDIVYEGIIFVFGCSTLIFLVFFFIGWFIRKNKISAVFKVKFKNKNIIKINIFNGSLTRRVITFCLIVFLGVMVPVNMIGYNTYVAAQKTKTSFFEKYYVDPSEVEITFKEKKKNLIYIYVESLESNIMSIENGGVFEESYIPNLERIAKDNINFSSNDKLGGMIQVENTGWTMAALVAQTAGIPFKIPIDGNSYNAEKTLPGAYSLGQILKDNGYKNYFMMGSDGDYGGRKKYFVQHGSYEIYDYYYAINDQFIPKDYNVWWGYEDKKLFTYAKKKLLDISKNDEPFNFTILTADTHFTDGYMDETCIEKFDNKYANAFYCSDTKIYNFIEWVKKQDFYKDTTIVIVGDHLTMQEGFYPVGDTSQRYVYNAIINSSVESDNTKNRSFTHFDIYPTTLAAMGADIDGDRLGLGVNLFSDRMTLIEKVGFDELNKNMSVKSDYYNKNILGQNVIINAKKEDK